MRITAPRLRRLPTSRTWSWFPIQTRSGLAAVVPVEPEVLAVPEDVVAQVALEEPAALVEVVAAPVEPEARGARALAAKAVLAELEPEAKPAEAQLAVQQVVNLVVHPEAAHLGE
jgi:hypothetical protein